MLEPIKTLNDIYSLNDVAIQSTGYFDRGYVESHGEQFIGSPIPITDDMGHVILKNKYGGYVPVFYQRTHHLNGVGLHNYVETTRVFQHVQSARRYAKQF